MEAEWPSPEFHCPTHRSGMHILVYCFPLISECTPVHLPYSYGCANAMSPQVSVIKVKIHEATGMPAGKQKLQYEVNFSFNPLTLTSL